MAALLAGLAAAYLVLRPTDLFERDAQTTGGAVALSAHLPNTQAPPNAEKLTRLSPSVVNHFELSHDLRKVYEQFKDSAHPLERHIAYRAWSACFPTFIAPQGQVVSINSLTQSLPMNDPRNAQRTEAYRALQARCLKFLDLSREDTLNGMRLQQESADHGQMLSPGEQASDYLANGNKQEALRVARDIIAAQDPYGISSLSEFIKTLIVLQVDAQSLPSTERADLRSMAFTLAACQMGLECGVDSLSALQLCTSLGACSGSVAERYLQALPSDSDRAELNLETARVLGAIRSGNVTALGL
ncbi:MAG: hypothetical protein ACOYB1_01645 [Limnohabitans sp.]